MTTFVDALRHILSQEKTEKFLIMKTFYGNVFYCSQRQAMMYRGKVIGRKGIWTTSRSKAMEFANREDAEAFVEDSNLTNCEVMLKVSG